MKVTVFSAIGLVGAAIAEAFGGWSSGLTTLLIFMGADYLTGLLVAGVFHRSEKSASGGLESRAGWKGLIRKGCTLLIVLVACRLDMLLGTEFVRDAVIIGFCANEALSIVENVGLMGVPLPRALVRAIELLKNKADEAADFAEETEECEDGD